MSLVILQCIIWNIADLILFEYSTLIFIHYFTRFITFAPQSESKSVRGPLVNISWQVNVNKIAVQFYLENIKMRYCCLNHCKKRDCDKSIVFFVIKQVWTDFVDRYADPKWKSRSRNYICSEHFEKKLIRADRHLVAGAMPTIPPGQLSTWMS